MTEHNFKPGAKVAILRHSFGRNYVEAGYVDKLYKSGRFTLKGSNQQYVNHGKDNASSTGNYRQAIEIWGEEHDTIVLRNIVRDEIEKINWREVPHKSLLNIKFLLENLPKNRSTYND